MYRYGTNRTIERRGKLIKTAVAYGLVGLALSGCAGKMGYTPPALSQMPPAMKTLNEPLDAVWARAVPALSKQFFVINNIDKASGLINVSYSGDPASYVDCGMISSHVQNLRGTRNYLFNGSAAYQEYESMESGNLFFIKRRMALEGRINLVFESIGTGSTRVTANTKYVVTKTVDISNPMGQAAHLNDSVSFNSGNGANFPGRASLECRATGALEKSVLDLL